MVVRSLLNRWVKKLYSLLVGQDKMCDSYGCKRKVYFELVSEDDKKKELCFNCFCKFFNTSKYNENNWRLVRVRCEIQETEVSRHQKRLFENCEKTK